MSFYFRTLSVQFGNFCTLKNTMKHKKYYTVGPAPKTNLKTVETKAYL